MNGHPYPPDVYVDGEWRRCPVCQSEAQERFRRRYRNRPVTVVEKRCFTCDRVLPASAFTRATQNSDGIASSCRKCVRDRSRDREYGMDGGRYEAMLEAQGGRCAICQEERPLAVDHDHRCCPGHRSCGRCIRGLICRPCNTALGSFCDDPVVLERAVKYLQASAELDWHMTRGAPS